MHFTPNIQPMHKTYFRVTTLQTKPMRFFLLLVLLVLVSTSGFSQHPLDRYVQFPKANELFEITEATGTIASAVDIDFHPDTTNRGLELWILNQGTENTGGQTTTVSFGKTSNTATVVKDGNSWHFMALASSLAFGDNGNWATAQDILDANHSNTKFTGPALWSSDFSIYGKAGNPPTSNNNGSRLDVTHQSPYGKGIAFESENIYWVMDGYDNTLKRYDFKKLNTPGARDDQDDDEVRVYTDFSFDRNKSLPAHIVIDEDKKWLYGCDTEGKRVFRVDITSGSYANSLTTTNPEALAAFDEYTGIKEETILDTALSQPVGIDVKGDRLLISDYGTRKLILFDLDNMKELGKISFPSLNNPGLKGVKIGPDGNIYFVDGNNGMVFRLENDSTPILVNNSIISQELGLFPNPSSQTMSFSVALDAAAPYDVVTTNGEIVMSGIALDGKNVLTTSELNAGVYVLRVKDAKRQYSSRFSVVR